ncbi:MAG: radical SAM protein [Deltaproteobacteria bacterium]|nr:radical SAM protein [Deltaproteobacteria bacterium]
MMRVRTIVERTAATYRMRGFWGFVKAALIYSLRKPQSEHAINLIVEPTSTCNLGCRMCPRREYNAENVYMSMELVNKVLQYPHIGTIELSGWGEPFLHPQIAKIVETVKRRGISRVVATSNGTMLERMLKAYEVGLDHISVSFDGGTKRTYESIRAGANWETMINNLSVLGKVGKSLQVNVTLMKENKDEIIQLIRVMANTGIMQIRLRNLDLITGEYNSSQSLYHANLSDMIDSAKEAARDYGISLSVDKINQNKSTSCRIPSRTMYISAAGEVSPCCALGHHISFEDENGKTDDIYTTFGNLQSRTLLEIWNDPRYIEFREKWSRGEVPVCCEHCYYRRD